jgi:hypothetical protein
MCIVLVAFVAYNLDASERSAEPLDFLLLLYNLCVGEFPRIQ